MTFAKRSAMRKFLAALIFLGSLSSAFAATYTIQSWPQDLDKVPRTAWQHNSDGSWTQIATIVVGKNATSGMIFRDSAEAKMLDAKCRH